MGYIKEPHGVTFTVLGLGITPEEQIALAKLLNNIKNNKNCNQNQK